MSSCGCLNGFLAITVKRHIAELAICNSCCATGSCLSYIDGISSDRQRDEAAFALARGVVVLLLFFCALLVSTLGLNFDLTISDLAQGDFHQSLVDLTSALQKIWVDYFLCALEQLFAQFPLLCTFVLSHWPWALLVLLVPSGIFWASSTCRHVCAHEDRVHHDSGHGDKFHEIDPHVCPCRLASRSFLW